MAENQKALDHEKLDNEYETNRSPLVKDLCELIKLDLDIASATMDKEEFRIVSNSFDLLQKILNNPSVFFSEVVTEDWTYRVKNYAVKNRIEFEDAIDKVMDPAGEMLCRVSQCLLDSSLAVFVHALFSYTWYYEQYKADSLPNTKEMKPKLVAEVKYLREVVHKVREEKMACIVRKEAMAMQMALMRQQNIKQ